MDPDEEGEGEGTLVYGRLEGFLLLLGSVGILIGMTPRMLDYVGVDVSDRLDRAAWIVLLAGLALTALAMGLAFRQGRREARDRYSQRR